MACTHTTSAFRNKPGPELNTESSYRTHHGIPSPINPVGTGLEKPGVRAFRESASFSAVLRLQMMPIYKWPLLANRGLTLVSGSPVPKGLRQEASQKLRADTLTPQLLHVKYSGIFTAAGDFLRVNTSQALVLAHIESTPGIITIIEYFAFTGLTSLSALYRLFLSFPFAISRVSCRSLEPASRGGDPAETTPHRRSQRRSDAQSLREL